MPFKLIVQNSKIVLKSVANYIINATGIKDLLTGDSSIDSNGKINWTLQEYTNTAANFTANNPVLLLGQKGIETDGLLTAPKFKIGDGVTAWNSLPYVTSSGGGTWGSITGTLSNQTDLQTALDNKEDETNKSTNVNTDQASDTKYPSVKAVYDWATGLFVKKGTLTTNYIPKATASDTIGNSSITDNGTDVNFNGDGVNAMVNWLSGATVRGEINTNNANSRWTFESKNGYDIMMLNGTTYVYYSGTNIRLATNNTDVLEITSGQKVNLPLLTASQIVETDSSKNLVSAAKGTAYNKAFGNTAGTVAEGNTSKGSNFYLKTGATTLDLRYTTNATAFTSTTQGVGKDVMHAMPFIVEDTMTFDRIGAEVTTSVASGVCSLLIYDSVNSIPTNLVLDAGTISVTSATYQEITINQQLTAGMYFLVIWHNGATTPSFRAIPVVSCNKVLGVSSTLGNVASNTKIQNTKTYGAAPSTYDTTGIALGTVNIPIIALRRSS